MAFTLHLCILLASVYLVHMATPCTTGWFGADCQYRCRCTNNSCDVNGFCVNGSKCNVSWFGPKCQYQDLMFLRSYINPESILVADGDDTTCVVQNRFTVQWSTYYEINWIRLIISATSQPPAINIILNQTYNDTKGSTNCQTTLYDARTVDILCEPNTTAKMVEFVFAEVTTICSCYVSGGRNVALKQTTKQSEDYRWYGNIYPSYLAVDGNNDTRTSGGSCSLTALKGVWNVTLNTPKLINRYVIYGSLDNSQYFLTNFIVQSFNNGGQSVYNYTNTSTKPTSVYTITVRSRDAIKFVNISMPWNNNYLTLCEVELYGDCEDGNWGLDCNTLCATCINQTCFKATGVCVYGCVPGYTGQTCTFPCIKTFYGDNCSRRCNPECVNQECHHVTGDCLSCEPGRVGLQCEHVCDNQTYGYKCLNVCSPQCVKSECEVTNGHCLTCNSGYTGDYCQEACDSYHYGPRCNATCSKHCLGTICNSSTGHCFSCDVGYQGEFCTSEAAVLTFPHGIGVGIAIICGVIVIVVAVVVVVWRCRGVSPPAAHRPMSAQAASAGDTDQTGKTSAQTVATKINVRGTNLYNSTAPNQDEEYDVNVYELTDGSGTK